MVGKFKRIGHPPRNKKIEWKEDENGCYICISHAGDKDGYPRIRDRYKNVGVHRYIYEECFGEIPKGMVIRHKCDNPKCINPEHLELGTHQDNSNDMVNRNRSCKGEKNGKSKLTKQDYEKILRARELDFTENEIAYIFGVNRAHINRLLKEGWKE